MSLYEHPSQPVCAAMSQTGTKARSHINMKSLTITAHELSLFCLILYFIFCLHGCLCSTCVPGVHGGQKRDIQPGTGVTDGCELPHKFWDLNPGPLEEQLVLLTTEPSLHLPVL